MIKEIEDILKCMRPAFARNATYLWFVIVFVGFVLRTDTFGVSSIVRALTLDPAHYPSLLHFFHSTAWTAEGLMSIWWKRIGRNGSAYFVEERMVLVGDHTKTPTIPLWATIQEGMKGIDKSRDIPKTIQLVQMAQRISQTMEQASYLVLDAYFSVGSVFDEAAKVLHAGQQSVHILTRAKKNITAYHV